MYKIQCAASLGPHRLACLQGVIHLCISDVRHAKDGAMDKSCLLPIDTPIAMCYLAGQLVMFHSSSVCNYVQQLA